MYATGKFCNMITELLGVSGLSHEYSLILVMVTTVYTFYCIDMYVMFSNLYVFSVRLYAMEGRKLKQCPTIRIHEPP